MWGKFMGWHNAVSNEMGSEPQVVLMMLWWSVFHLIVIMSDDMWLMQIWGIASGIMVAVCGAAISLYGHMVSGTNVALTGDFVYVGAVSIFWCVVMAFFSCMASVNICLMMASCNCLMEEMRPLVVDIAGNGVWFWNKMVAVIHLVLVYWMTAL